MQSLTMKTLRALLNRGVRAPPRGAVTAWAAYSLYTVSRRSSGGSAGRARARRAMHDLPADQGYSPRRWVAKQTRPKVIACPVARHPSNCAVNAWPAEAGAGEPQQGGLCTGTGRAEIPNPRQLKTRVRRWLCRCG